MTKRDGVKEIEEIIDIIERFRDDIEERHRRIYTGDILNVYIPTMRENIRSALPRRESMPISDYEKKEQKYAR